MDSKLYIIYIGANIFGDLGWMGSFKGVGISTGFNLFFSILGNKNLITSNKGFFSKNKIGI